MTNADVYLPEIHANLPRLLALFDRDPLSPTRGVGDRLHWAWKLKDFANGSFQGAVNGLASLAVSGQLPVWLDEANVVARIVEIVEGARGITRRNGSLEEAFPYESSFCVTALVAYDLLAAFELVRGRLDAAQRARWLETVAPMIRFVERNDERHGVISNHLATAVAAMLHWNAATGAGDDSRARALLGRVLEHASPEGWLQEYAGADPGYQTLALTYLVDAHRLRPEWNLLPQLDRCCEFLGHFLHPDGSFGGVYGSRNTRLCFPAGIEYLAGRSRHAAALALAIRKSIATRALVTLSAIDESGLVPMFNAYCWAARIAAASPYPDVGGVQLPRERPAPWRIDFRDAGLVVDRSQAGYTIVAWKKGGVVYHFPEAGGRFVNAGRVFTDSTGRRYSAQAYDEACTVAFEGDVLVVRARLRRLVHHLPRPSGFLVFRVLNLTFMRIPMISAAIKRLLVGLLISGKSSPIGTVVRRVRLAPQFSTDDSVHDARQSLKPLEVSGEYSNIHMASQGYWQAGD